jgi:hypothetical protein
MWNSSLGNLSICVGLRNWRVWVLIRTSTFLLWRLPPLVNVTNGLYVILGQWLGFYDCPFWRTQLTRWPPKFSPANGNKCSFPHGVICSERQTMDYKSIQKPGTPQREPFRIAVFCENFFNVTLQTEAPLRSPPIRSYYIRYWNFIKHISILKVR